MPGKITRVAVTYTMDTPDGPRHTFHGLVHMHRHIRPDYGRWRQEQAGS